MGPDIDVHQLLREGQTGDILLVSGTGNISHAIRAVTNSEWSHVGILVRDPPRSILEHYGVGTRLGSGYRNPSSSWEKERVFLFDSDFEEDDSVSGPTLRPLCDVLYNYAGDDYFGPEVKVVIREVFRDDGSRGLSAENSALLWPFMKLVEHKRFEPFDRNGFEQLVRSAFGFNRTEDDQCFFCSELCAESFQQMGLLHEKHCGGDHSNNFTPQNMIPGEKLDASTAGSGIHFGPLRKIAGLPSFHDWVTSTYPLDDVPMWVNLELTIVGAKGLRNADWVPVLGGLSDPYCACEVHAASLGEHHQNIYTPVVEDCLNPIWNHKADIQCFRANDYLTFQVYDRDRGRVHDKLGHCTLFGDRLMPHGTFDGDIPLVDAGDGIQAFLTVSIRPKGKNHVH